MVVVGLIEYCVGSSVGTRSSDSKTAIIYYVGVCARALHSRNYTTRMEEIYREITSSVYN